MLFAWKHFNILNDTADLYVLFVYKRRCVFNNHLFSLFDRFASAMSKGETEELIEIEIDGQEKQECMEEGCECLCFCLYPHDVENCISVWSVLPLDYGYNLTIRAILSSM